MKIVLTTQNPAKIDSTRNVLDCLLKATPYTLETVELEIEGPEPHGELKIVEAIKSGIAKARRLIPEAAYYVGMEGGIIEKGQEAEEAAYVLIYGEQEGRFSMSKAASFQIPSKVLVDVKNGIPFATSVEKNFKAQDVKRGGGFINILTQGIITKRDLYFQPLVIAFSQILNPEWYE